MSPSSNGAAPGDEAPQGLEELYGRQIAWEPCADQAEGPAGLECATVQVPLDYDDPTGKAISLALRRLPASGSTSQGSLFVNPGGPGDSVTALLGSAEDAFSEELRQSYDIVGFDPRGVGQSTPLECLSKEEARRKASEALEATGLESPGDADDPHTGPAQEQAGDGQAAGAQDAADPSPVEEAVSEGASTAQACLEHSAVPEIIDHMDTQSVARDMDVLRAQAGETRMTYLGFSYGTFLGAVYADLFPARVGRMVLDGAMDPSLQLSELQHSDAVSLQASLTGFVSYWQGRGDSPLSGTPEEGASQLAEFTQGLRADPITDPDSGLTLDEAYLTDLLRDAMYNDADWEDLASALGPVITDRDLSALVRLLKSDGGQDQQERPSAEQLEAEAAAQANAPAIYGVNCLDNPVRGDKEQWEAQSAERARISPLFGASEGAWSNAFCSGWGRQAVREPSQVEAKGAAPILVVGTTQDPATPYRWAQALADQLDSGHLLTAEGNKHCAYRLGSGDCVDAAVDAYLLKGSLPKEGSTCALPGPGQGAAQDAGEDGRPDPADGGRWRSSGRGLAPGPAAALPAWRRPA